MHTADTNRPATAPKHRRRTITAIVVAAAAAISFAALDGGTDDTNHDAARMGSTWS